MKVTRWLMFIAAVCVIVGITFNGIHKARSDEAPADPGYRLTISFVDPQEGPKFLTYGDPDGPIFKTAAECDAFKDGEDPQWHRVLNMLALTFAVRHIQHPVIKCVSRAELDEAHGGVKPSI